jgi:hypothetical protein
MTPLLLLLSVLGNAPAATPAAGKGGEFLAELDRDLARLEAGEPGLELGIVVWLEGKGLVYARRPEVPRAAASAIKSAVALDLLVTRRGVLEEVPPGLDHLLRPGSHPAFQGFSPEELAQASRELAGKTYLGLARVMMGRDRADRAVYNAACNVLMVKLGGPEAIRERLRRLDPAFLGLDLNRYMLTWQGDGDNWATPSGLLALYRLAAAGRLPGLDARGQALFRDLVRENGSESPQIFEKAGTLYPKPMARVHAGYVERAEGDLVYVVMGEVREPAPGRNPSDVLLRLLTAVDAVTMVCREIPEYLEP